MTMFGLSVCHSLFVNLAEFCCQARVPVFPQLHPGTKVEIICLRTWQVMKNRKSAKPANAQRENFREHPSHKEAGALGGRGG